MQTETDLGQRYVTRITEQHIFTLDLSDNSLTIKDGDEEEQHLRSNEIAALIDLLQQRDPRPVQVPFPQINWADYVVATFATYRVMATCHLTAERLIEESILQHGQTMEAYEITLANGEKVEALYLPEKKKLGITRYGMTHWETAVVRVDDALQTCINAIW